MEIQSSSSFAIGYRQTQQLISFASDISTPNCSSDFSTNIQSLLTHINRYFGYSASSFWLLHRDLSLSDPIAVNMDNQQLIDYLDWHHKHDYLYPQHMGIDVSDNSLIDCTKQNHLDASNPYHQFLQSRNLYHADSLVLRTGNDIWSIALFKPFANRNLQRNLTTQKCLEIATPMIAREIQYYNTLENNNKTTAALKTVFNDSKTAIIIFDRNRKPQVQYFNPITHQYASDFSAAIVSQKDMIESFANSLIRTYMEPLSEVQELGLTLTGDSGKKYNIRIVRTGGFNDKLYIIYADPCLQASVQEDNLNELFSLLSPTEQRVAALIAQGLSNQEIADKMFISLSTVKTHTNHIFTKINVANRSSLIAKINGTIAQDALNRHIIL